MDIQAHELKWYRANGRYPDRITKEKIYPFREYVIGDKAWNATNPTRQEYIERAHKGVKP